MGESAPAAGGVLWRRIRAAKDRPGPFLQPSAMRRLLQKIRGEENFLLTRSRHFGIFHFRRVGL
jgi:hypothetical protein